jgi:hypothetical protein
MRLQRHLGRCASMLVRPEELLDLPVLDPAGHAVGTVVDVGLVDFQRPKFLLVRWHAGRGVQRVELPGLAISAQGVRLARAPGALPA